MHGLPYAFRVAAILAILQISTQIFVLCRPTQNSDSTNLNTDSDELRSSLSEPWIAATPHNGAIPGLTPQETSEVVERILHGELEPVIAQPIEINQQSISPTRSFVTVEPLGSSSSVVRPRLGPTSQGIVLAADQPDYQKVFIEVPVPATSRPYIIHEVPVQVLSKPSIPYVPYQHDSYIVENPIEDVRVFESHVLPGFSSGLSHVVPIEEAVYLDPVMTPLVNTHRRNDKDMHFVQAPGSSLNFPVETAQNRPSYFLIAGKDSTFMPSLKEDSFTGINKDPNSGTKSYQESTNSPGTSLQNYDQGFENTGETDVKNSTGSATINFPSDNYYSSSDTTNPIISRDALHPIDPSKLPADSLAHFRNVDQDLLALSDSEESKSISTLGSNSAESKSAESSEDFWSKLKTYMENDEEEPFGDDLRYSENAGGNVKNVNEVSPSLIAPKATPVTFPNINLLPVMNDEPHAGQKMFAYTGPLSKCGSPMSPFGLYYLLPVTNDEMKTEQNEFTDEETVPKLSLPKGNSPSGVLISSPLTNSEPQNEQILSINGGKRPGLSSPSGNPPSGIFISPPLTNREPQNEQNMPTDRGDMPGLSSPERTPLSIVGSSRLTNGESKLEEVMPTDEGIVPRFNPPPASVADSPLSPVTSDEPTGEQDKFAFEETEPGLNLPSEDMPRLTSESPGSSVTNEKLNSKLNESPEAAQSDETISVTTNPRSVDLSGIPSTAFDTSDSKKNTSALLSTFPDSSMPNSADATSAVQAPKTSNLKVALDENFDEKSTVNGANILDGKSQTESKENLATSDEAKLRLNNNETSSLQQQRLNTVPPQTIQEALEPNLQEGSSEEKLENRRNVIESEPQNLITRDVPTVTELSFEKENDENLEQSPNDGEVKGSVQTGNLDLSSSSTNKPLETFEPITQIDVSEGNKGNDGTLQSDLKADAENEGEPTSLTDNFDLALVTAINPMDTLDTKEENAEAQLKSHGDIDQLKKDSKLSEFPSVTKKDMSHEIHIQSKDDSVPNNIDSLNSLMDDEKIHIPTSSDNFPKETQKRSLRSDILPRAQTLLPGDLEKHYNDRDRLKTSEYENIPQNDVRFTEGIKEDFTTDEPLTAEVKPPLEWKIAPIPAQGAESPAPTFVATPPVPSDAESKSGPTDLHSVEADLPPTTANHSVAKKDNPLTTLQLSPEYPPTADSSRPIQRDGSKTTGDQENVLNPPLPTAATPINETAYNSQNASPSLVEPKHNLGNPAKDAPLKDVTVGNSNTSTDETSKNDSLESQATDGTSTTALTRIRRSNGSADLLNDSNPNPDERHDLKEPRTSSESISVSSSEETVSAAILEPERKTLPDNPKSILNPDKNSIRSTTASSSHSHKSFHPAPSSTIPGTIQTSTLSGRHADPSHDFTSSTIPKQPSTQASTVSSLTSEPPHVHDIPTTTLEPLPTPLPETSTKPATTSSTKSTIPKKKKTVWKIPFYPHNIAISSNGKVSLEPKDNLTEVVTSNPLLRSWSKPLLTTLKDDSDQSTRDLFKRLESRLPITVPVSDTALIERNRIRRPEYQLRPLNLRHDDSPTSLRLSRPEIDKDVYAYLNADDPSKLPTTLYSSPEEREEMRRRRLRTMLGLFGDVRSLMADRARKAVRTVATVVGGNGESKNT